MSRKIIFLDIDGVLNSSEFNDIYRELFVIDPVEYDILDSGPIILVSDIVFNTGAEVVLSSSWREDEDAVWRAEQQLARYGVEIVDQTPLFGRNARRDDEINAWLDQHPEVTNYVILDDTPMVTSRLEHHQVRTTMARGLLRRHADLAIEILNREDEK